MVVAGVCSGDFHVYQQQPRKEMERVDRPEREAQADKNREERVKAFEQLVKKETMKTIKRIAKRRRRKQRRVQRPDPAKVVHKAEGNEEEEENEQDWNENGDRNGARDADEDEDGVNSISSWYSRRPIVSSI